MSYPKKGECRNTGKTHFKKGFTPWNKGLTGFRSGDKSNFWKGGIMSINKKIRNSLELKSWRISVFERDKFLCQMPDCDKTERYLNAHHIKRFEKYPNLRFEINNGITLCKRCHNKTKHKEEKFENMFLEIIYFWENAD